jgi:chromosome segregation ATPase
MAESNPNEYMRGYQDALDSLRSKIDSDPLVRLSWNRPTRPADPPSSPVCGTGPAPSPSGQAEIPAVLDNERVNAYLDAISALAGPERQGAGYWVRLSTRRAIAIACMGVADEEIMRLETAWLDTIHQLRDKVDQLEEQAVEVAPAQRWGDWQIKAGLVRDLRSQVNRLQRRVKDDKAIIERAERAMHDAMDMTSRVERQRDAAEDLAHERDNEIGSLKGRLSRLEKQHNSVIETSRARREEIDRLKIKVDRLNRHMKECQW